MLVLDPGTIVRVFAGAGPSLWNKSLASIRASKTSSVNSFYLAMSLVLLCCVVSYFGCIVQHFGSTGSWVKVLHK